MKINFHYYLIKFTFLSFSHFRLLVTVNRQQKVDFGTDRFTFYQVKIR